ncbi:MAG: hypothetical protein QME90_03000 [Thermodesulfobacteriota bacterium]|nr:hypothetical protein [Thermodesulfobacteriota bacterium]
MATQDQLNGLKNIAQRFRTIDNEKLLRPSLGEESLKGEFTPTIGDLRNKIDFASEYAPNVHDTYISPVVQVFEQICVEIEAQANRSNAEYVAQRANFLRTIEDHIEQLRQYWPPFISAAVEIRGFIQDEGFRKEYQSTIESMREESTKALSLIKEEASKTIEEARKLAQQIEDRARRTAAHISVGDAQEQFKLAQKGLNNQVILWAVLSVVFIIAFLLAAYCLVSIKLPEEWKWHVIYYTAIRVTILAAIGAIATFCLRILRAHLHLSQHNLHRQRVANSMAAFVESAVTPEQRDFILAQLVDAVVRFGCSGLLQKEDDSIYSPKMTIDTITRNLIPPSVKQQ